MTWLNDLITRIFAFFPRLIMIAPDEAGVRVTLGTRVKVLESGWYFVWPLIQEVTAMIVTPQVVDLRGQSIMEPDGKSLAVSGAIEYRISRIEKAILSVQDLDRSLQNLALGIIADIVSSKDVSLVEFKDELLKRLRDRVSDWGVKIIQVYITDYADHAVYRVINDGNGYNMVLPK